MVLGDVRARIGQPAQAVLDCALECDDRLVVLATAVVGAREIRVALGHVQAPGVRELRQLVEELTGAGEIALLEGLLEVHEE